MMPISSAATRRLAAIGLATATWSPIQTLGSRRKTRSDRGRRRNSEVPSSWYTAPRPGRNSPVVSPVMRVPARASGSSPSRWRRSWPASSSPSRTEPSAAVIACCLAGAYSSTSWSSSVRYRTCTPWSRRTCVKMSCSCWARAAQGRPAKSSCPAWRGSTRFSSAPGRCTMTARSLPTSLSTPLNPGTVRPPWR